MEIKENTVVSVHYTGTLENGEVFDTSEGREPLTFLVGHGQMIPGFEEEMMGSKVDEKRKFKLTPDRAYGEIDQESVKEIPREQFPEDIEIDMVLAAVTDDGMQVPLRITEIKENEVVVDFNHKLAGETLTFEVTVVEIRDATEEETSHGHAHGPEGHHH